MPEHTPTPWTHQPSDSGAEEWDVVAPFPGLPGEPLFVATTMGMEVAHGGAEANAAFIVKAANSHDELVAALRDCIDRVTAAFPDAETYEPIKKARAVLAKVEAA